jgi:CheY-like chemotaxis protein
MADVGDTPSDAVVLCAPGDGATARLAQLRQIPQLEHTPVVVLAERPLSAGEERQLRDRTQGVVIRQGGWEERLLDETALVLHRDDAALPQAVTVDTATPEEEHEPLVGRKVLLVDDDIRNLFALTSLLERHGMQVISADSGREALEILERTDDLSLVLMDVMMPDMDGYETMQRIHSQPRLRELPIIALTAKAMKGDREKCLAAGASDYVAKPVDTAQLLALLRLWLSR